MKTRSESPQHFLAATRCGAERVGKASYRKDGFENNRCAKRAQSSKQDDREIEVQGEGCVLESHRGETFSVLETERGSHARLTLYP